EMLAWAGSGYGSIWKQFTAADGAGNLYLAGSMRGGLDFETNLFSGSDVGSTVFVVKFGPDGHVLWARTSGPGDNAGLMSLGVDAGGNVYLMGTLYHDATFGQIRLALEGTPSVYV